MFVASTFWCLYFVDRELIFPRAIDPYFPAWLNHAMHTNIVIALLAEVFTAFRSYPTRKQGLSLLAVVMMCYLIWIHVINYYTGQWVYPILEVLNFQLRLVFFAAMLGFLLVLYISGEKLNNSIWKNEMKHLKKNFKKY